MYMKSILIYLDFLLYKTENNLVVILILVKEFLSELPAGWPTSSSLVAQCVREINHYTHFKLDKVKMKNVNS